MTTLQKIGKYEILAKIGEGGFGVVYKGKDPFIKRLVAVKTCSSENESIQKRFFREAEIAGNLHHANVVTIHDFGVEGDTPYLVQEFLTGEDLDVLISDPNLQISLPTKVRYLRSIAEGLRYAHAQGVIHRDIKPANIRILENNRVKVMDFGIAKLKDQESQLTQTGMALGTVAYMSPEQLKGESVDHRVDIFSFGVLAYELVVGKRPFQAESVSTLFYLLLHENPPAITDPEVPKQLVDVIEKCLAKSLDVRYGSFDEVLRDLGKVQVLVGDDQEAVTADPFSTDPTSTLTRLAAKAARSIDAGDLTAAEVTLDLARKQCDPATFDREFGPLLTSIQEKRATRTTGHPQIPGLDLDSQIGRIEQQLEAGKLDTAAVAFTALEMQFPGEPRVAALRTRVSQAVQLPPPFAGGPKGASPVESTPIASTPLRAHPPPVAGAARQQARTAPLIATIAVVLLIAIVGGYFLVRSLRDRGGTSGEAGAGDGQIERVDGGSATDAGGGDAGVDRLNGGDDVPGTGDPNTGDAASDSGSDGAGSLSTDGGDAGNTTVPGDDAGGSDGGSTSSRTEASGGETSTSADRGQSGRTSGTATTPGGDRTGRTSGGDSRTSGGDSRTSGGDSRTGSGDTRTEITRPSGDRNGGRDTGRNDTSSGSRGSDATTSSGATNTGGGDRNPATSTQGDRSSSTPGDQTGGRESGRGETTDRNAQQQQQATDQTTSRPSDGGAATAGSGSSSTGFDLESFQTQNDISRTLFAYRDAWISKDEKLINRYFPGANVTRQDVRYRQIEARVRCDSFEISDRAATASCNITIIKRPRSGDPETTTYTRADLEKRGVDWVIVSLR